MAQGKQTADAALTLGAPVRRRLDEPSQASSVCSLVLASLPEMMTTAEPMPGSMYPMLPSPSSEAAMLVGA